VSERPPGEWDILSRRQVVGSLGAGVGAELVNLVAIPALAQSSALNSAHTTAQPMQDPVRKYPKPPFKKQSQPWPGLASKMDPKPAMARQATKAAGVWRAARR
jgi:hypothetical protein